MKLTKLKLVCKLSVVLCVMAAFIITSELIYKSHFLNTEQNDHYDVRQYHPRYNRSLEGQRFNIHNTYQPLLLPPSDFVEVTQDAIDDIVFVTYSSQNHWKEGIAALDSIQKFFPKSKIIYYDLGLNEDIVQQLKRMSQIEYNKFNFSKYPAHVSSLNKYAWKPLMVMDALSRHPSVFYMDASIRFQTSNLSVLLDQLQRADGMLQFDFPMHSNFAATHQGMYNYLVTDQERLKLTIQQPGGIGLVVRTQRIYNDVLFWWMLCALDINCIAPAGSNLYCKRDMNGLMNEYGGCHRYDQSAINILLLNYHKFTTPHVCSIPNIMRIGRA